MIPGPVAQYFNNFFTCKINRLRKDVCFDDVQYVSYILDRIMKDKICGFEFSTAEAVKVEELLISVNNEKQSGFDDLDGRLLKISAHLVASPITHIFNQSIFSGVSTGLEGGQDHPITYKCKKQSSSCKQLPCKHSVGSSTNHL